MRKRNNLKKNSNLKKEQTKSKNLMLVLVGLIILTGCVGKNNQCDYYFDMSDLALERFNQHNMEAFKSMIEDCEK